jgi:hypothetical protein
MKQERKISLGSILCPHCQKSITLTKVVRIIEPATKGVKEEEILAEKNVQSTLPEMP